MVVLSLLSHPSCLAASIVSVLGLSQARLFLLVRGGGGGGGGRFVHQALPDLFLGS